MTIITTFLALLYNPPPAFRPKNMLFIRNRGRWFRISTSFSPQTSSFGDICVLPPSEICTRSTRTSWSCTPWSQFFYSKFFLKFLTFFVYYVHEGSEGVFRVFTFEVVCRVFTFEGVCRIIVGYLLIFTFEGVCRVFTLRVYVGYLLWGCM